MSAAQPRLPCLSTGSAAFDEILGGGLPVRSVNVIAGEPGAGKTIFALQMLFHQARQGKKGLYLTTLSEPSLKLVNYMQQFSFFDERLIADKRVVIADLGSVMRRKGVDETLAEIIGRVEQEEPALVVIDSFKALRDLLGDAPAMRTFNYDLAVHVGQLGRREPVRGGVHGGGDRDLLGVRHRRRHHPARQPPRRAAGDSRGRGPQAARGQRRDRRSLLRDHRRRAGVLPARAQPGRLVPRAGGARRARADRRRGPRRHAGRRPAAGERHGGPGRDGDRQDDARPAVPARGGAAGRAGHSLRARGDREPAPSHRPGVRMGSRARSKSAGSSPSATSLPSSSRPIASCTKRGTRWRGWARAGPCSTA